MADEDLSVQGVSHRLIRLPSYDKALRQYRKLEPRLHAAVRKALSKDLEGEDLDEIQGTGGWIKGRVASPSRGMGKRGGFRVIYLLLRVHHDLYLQTVYDHRKIDDVSHEDREKLKAVAAFLKSQYQKEN